MSDYPRPDRDLDPKVLLDSALFVGRISLPVLWSQNRHLLIVTLRGALVAIARRRTCLSFPEIGRHILGNRNYSTAITALRRFEREQDHDMPPGTLDGYSSPRLLAQVIEGEADRRMAERRRQRSMVRNAIRGGAVVSLAKCRPLSDTAAKFLVFA